MAPRKSARIASRKPIPQKTRPKTRRNVSDDSDFDDPEDQSVISPTESDSESTPDSDSDLDVIDTPPTKRRKTQPPPKRTLKPQPTKPPSLSSPSPLASLLRPHAPAYHTPLLLTSPSSRTSLLTWFDATSTARSMPWRQPFSPPATLSPSALSQRAYQVWISEVMLQQTRVAVVIGYWTRWMARWPAISDLAAASEEEVLGMWQGLGYYSRARRVWQAARLVCEQMGAMLPGEVGALMRVPGVGRYTAGAVASIVFGVAAPVVDGNVLRVLSRQMGVLGDVKGDKAVIERLWDTAEQLVKAVAGDGDGEEPSDRPGRWGQALMELGSTVCTPKPNCAACPITETCKAYTEGLALAGGGSCIEGAVEDMEDFCGLCAPLEEADDGSATTTKGRKDKEEASRFFETNGPAPGKKSAPDAQTLDTIVQHARKFPLRKPKKKAREEETLVCAIRRSDGQYLIHQRPEKGLLAGLWELPSHILPGNNNSTAKNRKPRAVSYVTGLVSTANGKDAGSTLKHVGELGSIPWLFSHLKLTMHVHLFELDAVSVSSSTTRERWASIEDIDSESMGTGMKKCWAMVKETVKLD
ncbi:A/G-specific adenine DNA glycosylase [Staphylotrichum tortipilum]|uniref:Adenine DNA glycosylase n=1 Tax=Staphylotrichum tortipilum TaxID=2831512 RepID=A0AAN6MFL2_9PEZI|nr:A/G-specific adenine DNA glycosylase [Staphylotrichum longicolle]